MAVGEGQLPQFHPIEGVRIGVASAGIKKAGKDDLVLFEVATGAAVSAVFTQNKFCAAPVQIAQDHLARQVPKYLLVNTGNANAGTGKDGIEHALASCRRVAEVTDCSVVQVLPFSTGVIGEPLPVEKLCQAVPDAVANLAEDNWARAASGIMTTDTRPKGASVEVDVLGTRVHISGISKGAGMIQPNMATMLAYVATDAEISPHVLQALLNEATQASFNRITIDGDTSTNDACVLVATGARSGQAMTELTQPEWQPFRKALNELMQTLAQAIVRDAEGATKFVTIKVEKAASQVDALEVAYTIAHSPLVKTALFASDPNWGRILAAVGRSRIEKLDVERVDIYLGETAIVEKGGRASSYTEAAGQVVMDQDEIEIRVVLNQGAFNETLWTSDLSHEYVRINAEYRT